MATRSNQKGLFGRLSPNVKIILGFVILLVLLPVAVWSAQNTQNLFSHASYSGAGYGWGTCGANGNSGVCVPQSLLTTIAKQYNYTIINQERTANSQCAINAVNRGWTGKKVICCANARVKGVKFGTCSNGGSYTCTDSCDTTTDYHNPVTHDYLAPAYSDVSPSTLCGKQGSQPNSLAGQASRATLPRNTQMYCIVTTPKGSVKTQTAPQGAQCSGTCTSAAACAQKGGTSTAGTICSATGTNICCTVTTHSNACKSASDCLVGGVCNTTTGTCEYPAKTNGPH